LQSDGRQVAQAIRLVAAVAAAILDENEKPIITLKTLGDVRKMLLRLPKPFQLKTTWGHVAVMLDEAARGGDVMDVVVPLRMVLGMEGIASRPK
jgi:hypothetical protein